MAASGDLLRSTINIYWVHLHRNVLLELSHSWSLITLAVYVSTTQLVTWHHVALHEDGTSPINYKESEPARIALKFPTNLLSEH